MYSCSNWGLCFSVFLHWFHDSQKSVLALTNMHGKLAAGIRVQPRELDLFPCKVSCAMNGIFRGLSCLSFFPQKLEFRVHACCSDACSTCHSVTVGSEWKLCPLLKTVLAVITPRITKVFLGRFCSGITRLRSATRASALSPSLRPVTDVGPRHANTLARKNKRRARSCRGRRRRVPRFNSVSYSYL